MPAHVSENNTRITFTISKELKDSIEECAQNEKRSLSNMINIAIEEYVKRERA